MYGFVLHSLLLQHLGKVWQVMSVSGYRCSLRCGPAEREREMQNGLYGFLVGLFVSVT